MSIKLCGCPKFLQDTWPCVMEHKYQTIKTAGRFKMFVQWWHHGCGRNEVLQGVVQLLSLKAGVPHLFSLMVMNHSQILSSSCSLYRTVMRIIIAVSIIIPMINTCILCCHQCFNCLTFIQPLDIAGNQNKKQQFALGDKKVLALNVIQGLVVSFNISILSDILNSTVQISGFSSRQPNCQTRQFILSNGKSIYYLF